ncbi:MAG: hypothetical protein R2851_13005 [Caldilineaceae bacterium]
MATGWLTTDELPPRIPFSEEDRVDTPNAYALSKYLGEKIADSMVVRYPHMAICSMRINNVIPPERYDILQYRRDNFPEGGGNFWSYIDTRCGRACRAALEGESRAYGSSSSPRPTRASTCPSRRRWPNCTVPAPTSPRITARISLRSIAARSSALRLDAPIQLA